MICPNCHNSIALGEVRCPHCGGDLPFAARVALRRGSAPVRSHSGPGEGTAPTDGYREAPLVDQDHVLRRLKAAWRAAQEGRGQLVSLIGELGCGRSRLIRELGHTIDEGAPGALWLVGQAHSYATYLAYGLLTEVLAPWATDGASRDIPTRLASALAALALDAEGAEREALGGVAAQIRAAANLGTVEPQALAGALGGVVQGAADGQPLVVVLEDLEWSDAASLGVLDLLLAPLLEGPTLVLCTHHADWSHEWPDVARHHQLILGPLPRSESRQLIEILAGDVPLSEPAIETLVVNGGGNPLLLEQATYAVREQGPVQGLGIVPAIPTTLQEAILARLEVLSGDARDVLVAAATIGQQFAYDAVSAVAGQPAGLDGALRELVRRRLVQRWSAETEVVYRFTHGLIQEVAYSSLRYPERQVLEARVADWLLSESALQGTGAARVIEELTALAPASRGRGTLAPVPVAAVDDLVVGVAVKRSEPPAWPLAMQQGRRNAVLARIVLGDLTPDRRASVVLCLQHGYSYADAGELLGLPREEVRAHLYEARQIFQRLYDSSDAVRDVTDERVQRVQEEAG